jgi:NAD-dependent deacetylase
MLQPMNIFVLTGAGISAESGLGTFRDTSGLWTRFDPMKLATPQAYRRDPARVHAFYDARRANLRDAQPNPAHVALAELQQRLKADSGRLYLCTQNIDDLHERAGADPVTHIHGELFKARCVGCAAVRAWREDMGGAQCETCGADLRPHVVWFGEEPLEMEAIYAALLDSDLFVAIGTSGSVYPAAGFVSEARRAGIRTCEINLEPSDTARAFDERHYGPATEVVPVWAARVLA